MDFVTVIPNLDRRHDRWLICLGALTAFDFPSRRIRRFSAHDGQLYSSFEDARDDAGTQFPGATFIVNNNYIGRHYYCWAWSWYDIMSMIADGAYGDYVLVLVDDCCPAYPHERLCNYLQTLVELTDELRCIQFSPNDQVPVKPDTPVPEGDIIDGLPFRRGITSSGDTMNLVTPAGAEEILNSANSIPNLGVPNWVFWHLARLIDTRRNYFTALGDHTKYLAHNCHTNNFEDGRYHTPPNAP